jgi:glutathione peroxidase-family protein
VFTKADINGKHTRPTYALLKDTGMGQMLWGGKIKWNFAGKFIVDKSGNISLPRSDEEVLEMIQEALS